MFAIGVGIGSMLCARLLKGEVSAKFVPFAALGITIFTWDFGTAATNAHGLTSVLAILHTPIGWRMLIDLLLLAACGGLYLSLIHIFRQKAQSNAA